MTSASHPITQLIEKFGSWLDHRRAVHEIEELSHDDGGAFTQIAHDLGVAPSDLDAFVRQGPHAADELPQLLVMLGIDEERLAMTQPLLLADMQRVCSFCGDKRRCHREIAAGTLPTHFHEFCDNAWTIESLQQVQ
ncbi:hypothetical protein [Bradyrhizobium sp. WD16]|uniref:hypothetical protein n=1 Tax=Bradyrhizobium sp. WD16 TaxID=1521768 RepID=UPI0020A254B5|nr:hypothetical protein [Bradyrhizobium sp. WD16]UTD29821.1 hypothetical protein DB459_25850 [Bradyrhizobium sp. WD16]